MRQVFFILACIYQTTGALVVNTAEVDGKVKSDLKGSSTADGQTVQVYSWHNILMS
jgi:hypothetical protein